MLVGKKLCRALSLADGKKQLWQVETGEPSGLGVAVGSLYYLPLRQGSICVVDLTRGIVASRLPASTNAAVQGLVPGNLIFHDGYVISQTEAAVACYPQMGHR